MIQSALLEKKEFPLWIGGEAVKTATSRTIKLPYDGSPMADVYETDQAAFARAVSAAGKGARSMDAMTLWERAELLERIRALVAQRADEFVRLIVSECGKPLREARAEVERSQQTLLASADAARSLRGEVVPMEAAPTGRGRWAMTVREPLGVIGAITPFNFPLNLALHKVGPALAAGNSVIHKPSENTPLSALRLAPLIHEAGAPAGAYNVVTGPGETTGDWLVSDDRVKMITFTGSIPVGEQIRAKSGLRRVSLELGNNSSLIIEPDADLDTLIPRCVTGSFAHSGQVCISVQNIFVQEQIFDEFTERFVEATRKLKIGHPLEESTEVSSLINPSAAERVESWIKEARDAGGRILTGGARSGATIEPAILAGVPPHVRLSCQEVFGPVASVHSYRAIEEPIEQINGGQYGLQAGVCTRDLSRAFKAAQALQFGGVMINDVPAYRVDLMPYGGVKNSGVGREGPRYAIEEMTEMKLICWRV